MPRAPQMPPGAWPRLMRAETAAAYVDEVSVERFLARVGTAYPEAMVIDGRGKVWSRTALDAALDQLESRTGAVIHDAADLM
jgi:hypothetical protein